MKRIAFFASFVGAHLFFLLLLVVASYFSFSHGAKASVAITNVRAENIVGRGAHIKWTTDTPSDSRVAYTFSTASSTSAGGTSASYFFSNHRCDDGGQVVTHCVNLTELATSTAYAYKVESSNTTGDKDGSSAGSAGGFYFTSASGENTVSSTTDTETVSPSTSAHSSTTTSTENSTTSGTPATSVTSSSDSQNVSLTTDTARATTSPSFPPVSFSVKMGEPQCRDGYTVAQIFFAVNPSNAGYFSLNGSLASSSQALEKTRAFFPSGTYSWKGIPRMGYSVSGPTQGDFIVPSLLKCSLRTDITASSTIVIATTSTTTTIHEPVRVHFSLAPKVRIVRENKSSTTEIHRERAIVPEIVARDTVKEIPRLENHPESYQKTEEVLRQKYQEAEKAFRKENHVPPAKVVNEESARKIVEEVRAEFPVLSQSSDSIRIGTTTLSRKSEPARIDEEISRVMAERPATPTLVDSDLDGISDYDETHIYGTDPNKSDTDADGIKDGDEILSGTDPLKKIIAPIPHEDPKEVVEPARTYTKLFSVQKVAIVSAPEKAIDTKPVPKRVALEGTAPPNSFVTLYIFSTPVIVTVKTDRDGKWQYTMDKELENGKHEVYVAMTESSGKIIVKSDPIPFIKTAQAVSLPSEIVLPNTTSPNSPSAPSFFRGGTLTLSLILLFVLLGVSFMLISLVSKKKE